MLRRLTALSLYLGALTVGIGLLLISAPAWQSGAIQFAELDSPRPFAAGGIAQRVLMLDLADDTRVIRQRATWDGPRA